jgi:hypothetical protein
MAGTLFFNDRDVTTDFLFVLQAMSGLPGTMGSAPRDLPMLDGPEVSEAILDPRLMRRKPGTASVRGFISAPSVAAMVSALDALKGVILGGEFAVRTGYASDRQCFAVCDNAPGEAFVGEMLDGKVAISLSLTIRSGVAERLVPDGYALSTTRVACPQWTAETRPVILVHGGGAALTNPVVTMRNAGGDSVQSVGFTVSLGANDALRIDCARGLVSKIASGVVSDALAAGYWTSGDFALVFRPLVDGNPEAGAYPSLELSASSGTPVGRVTYTRRAA